jgi:hypothetical protein
MAAIADHSSRNIETTCARRAARAEEREPDMNLTIRLATATDASAVRRLAALDSSFPPTGEVLLAEMGDELWAALSVDTGAAIADPFRPSRDLVELLRFRADRLSADERPSRALRAHLLPRVA